MTLFVIPPLDVRFIHFIFVVVSEETPPPPVIQQRNALQESLMTHFGYFISFSSHSLSKKSNRYGGKCHSLQETLVTITQYILTKLIRKYTFINESKKICHNIINWTAGILYQIHTCSPKSTAESTRCKCTASILALTILYLMASAVGHIGWLLERDGLRLSLDWWGGGVDWWHWDLQMRKLHTNLRTTLKRHAYLQ